MYQVQQELGLPYDVPSLIRRFLYDQFYPQSEAPGADVPLHVCPPFHHAIDTFHSAVATYYAPSDMCGIHGMYRERIRANPTWGKEGMPRHDCVFIEEDPELPGFAGLGLGRIRLLFSFAINDTKYPCALIEWFKKIGDGPDPDLGMWMVEREMKNGQRVASVVHLDTILRGAHLTPAFGEDFVPRHLRYVDTLDVFQSYYVNKYIDGHGFETIF
jgi:hypothetical protein